MTAGTEGHVVPTVAAPRDILTGTTFLPKPTALTADLHERSATAWTASTGRVRAGYWECGAGAFTAARDGEHEVCYIVSGSATLRDAAGERTDVSAGSILALPSGWVGTWEVHEPIVKVFVLAQG